MNSQSLSVQCIRLDGGTQPRAEINRQTVHEYAEEMNDGAQFPAITVFYDGTSYWLADGFHRVEAAVQCARETVEAEVKQGTQRDAILYSVGANVTHGLRRSNEDKRRAVLRLLHDAEWVQWSDREIARRCGVTHPFVGQIRAELSPLSSGNNYQITPRIVERNGTTYTQNTENIGLRYVPFEDEYDEHEPGAITYMDDFEEDTRRPIPKAYLPTEDDDEWLEVDTETGEILEGLPGIEDDDQPKPSLKEITAGKSYIMLPQWQSLGIKEREVLLTPSLTGDTFNAQKNDNIEWAMWSWNPVTGCKHDCPYCYARDIALRFYDQKFEPSFWPGRLSAPANTKVPSIAATQMGYKNVFTCSMADLFGRWVPTEWIEAVLNVVRHNPQWNFLFLTKFPIRLSEFAFPDNAWVGTTVDCQIRVKNAENAFRNVRAKVKWLSCEPLLEPLEFSDLGMFQWIVLGGASSSTQTPEWRPPRAWIAKIEARAAEAGCMIYEKTNLLERYREYPGAPYKPAVLPDALRYLPSIEKVTE